MALIHPSVSQLSIHIFIDILVFSWPNVIKFHVKHHQVEGKAT